MILTGLLTANVLPHVSPATELRLGRPQSRKGLASGGARPFCSVRYHVPPVNCCRSSVEGAPHAIDLAISREVRRLLLPGSHCSWCDLEYNPCVGRAACHGRTEHIPLNVDY